MLDVVPNGGRIIQIGNQQKGRSVADERHLREGSVGVKEQVLLSAGILDFEVEGRVDRELRRHHNALFQNTTRIFGRDIHLLLFTIGSSHSDLINNTFIHHFGSHLSRILLLRDSKYALCDSPWNGQPPFPHFPVLMMPILSYQDELTQTRELN